MRSGKGVVAGIAYEFVGPERAVPLVLVRPLGSAAPLWRPFVRALAREEQVILFDPLGAGSSAGAPRSSTRAMASDAVVLLDALGLRRVHVFGQSLGGMVATWLAAHPRGPRVERLVLASTCVRGTSFLRPNLGSLGFPACAALPRRSIESCLVKRILSARFLREEPAAAAAIIDRARKGRARRTTLLAHSIAGAAHDASDVLARLSASVLVVGGELDDVLGIGPQRDLADRIPRARFEILRGVGHDITLEAPERVASLVSAFVREAPDLHAA